MCHARVLGWGAMCTSPCVSCLCAGLGLVSRSLHVCMYVCVRLECTCRSLCVSCLCGEPVCACARVGCMHVRAGLCVHAGPGPASAPLPTALHPCRSRMAAALLGWECRACTRRGRQQNLLSRPPGTNPWLGRGEQRQPELPGPSPALLPDLQRCIPAPAPTRVPHGPCSPHQKGSQRIGTPGFRVSTELGWRGLGPPEQGPGAHGAVTEGDNGPQSPPHHPAAMGLACLGRGVGGGQSLAGG